MVARNESLRSEGKPESRIERFALHSTRLIL